MRSKRRDEIICIKRVPVETLVSAPMTIPPSYSHATMVVPVFGASSFPEEEEEKDGTLGSILLLFKSALLMRFGKKSEEELFQFSSVVFRSFSLRLRTIYTNITQTERE